MSNKIISNGKTIYRILVDDESRCLVVDCLKRTVPCWVKKSELDTFNKVVSEEDLLEAAKRSIKEIGELSQEQLKEVHLRFATISYPLSKIGDEVERRLAIHQAAEQYKVSEQTIRHRLCDYLVFQSIMVLAPGRKVERGLTEDERSFRWALNKYFYNSKKFSLRQTYKYLVSEKYIDANGKLLQKYPKFHQFRYFYYKTRSESNFVISRWGRGEYDRNYRPLLGEGVRSFCPTIGYGMLDSTTCDIFLVNDSGELIGRPILTACVDAYSSMCLGYSLGWEGGINSLRKLMMNVVVDKVEWCRKFGIEIEKNDWDSQRIPHKLITDMGSEYVGDTFTNLTGLGIEIVNLEPYRPELKSVVERFFGLVQESFKKELINKGVVLKNFGDRGVIDYRKNACLTLEQFEKILLLCIIHYNCGRTIELPYEVSGIKNHANALWNSRLDIEKDVLIEVDSKLLRLTLLPRCAGRFRRDGLIVNKLRYKAFGFINEYLKGEECQVAYDPENIGTVWLLKDGVYVAFTIIDTFLEDRALSEVKELDSSLTDCQEEKLESEIRLLKALELVANSSEGHPKVRKLRENRQNEIRKGKKHE